MTLPCRAESADGYLCTLDHGHHGDHVARDLGGVAARWPREVAP